MNTVEQYAELLNSNMPHNSTIIQNPNYEAYGVYTSLLTQGGIMEMDLTCLNKSNIDLHFNAILSIFRDGIETDQVHNMKIYGTYADNIRVPFSIFDYFINLIFWHLPICCGDKITSDFYIYEKAGFTQKSIKRYIDKLFLDKHRSEYSNIWLNNAIDDVLYKFKYIDEFSMYFMNTFNHEDTITLMNLDKEFYDAIHLDVSNIPLEDVKSVGEAATDVAIKKIIDSKWHCFAPYFKSGQGINRKQFREFQINIGTKPDGKGNIFPTAINGSYVNGAINSSVPMVIDGQVARIAQILQKNNVGLSGAMARLTSINNLDTKMHPDLNYKCNTKNNITILVDSIEVIKRLKGRYYKLSKAGIIKRIPFDYTKCENLIGREILLYSPITCASHAKGKGYCRQCYGDLAYTNQDINPGKFASDETTAQLTQRMLSAKHLLETAVRAMKWVQEFYDLFSLECNIITTIEGVDYSKYKLLINEEDFEYNDDELDSFEYSVSVKQFKVQRPGGKIYTINTEDMDDIYIAKELSDIISKKKSNDNGDYVINMDTLDGVGLFCIKLVNVELSQALDDVIACIDRQTTINTLKTKDAIAQRLLTNIIKSGLGTDSIHLEVLLSNQVRSSTDILENPEWENENEKYQMLTLKSALSNHPSIAISLEYNHKLAAALMNPLSFKKYKSSVVDLFYMIQPQNYMSSIIIEDSSNADEMVKPFVIKPDPDLIPVGDSDEELDSED